MGESIRIVERALGDGHKVPTSSERDKAAAYWRSLHAARDLPAGHVIKQEDVAVVRPNDGLHPRHLDDVLGMALDRPLRVGAPLRWDCFKQT
jgi:sialic acid synthase SpsE